MRQVILTLWVFFSGAGLVSCKPQDIDRDISHWYTYRTIIDGIEVSFKLPPDGKVFNKPPSKIDVHKLNENEEYSPFAYFGYDYGSKSSDKVSQFHFGFGLSRYAEPLENEITVEELVEKTDEERKRSNVVDYDVVSINGRKWFYEQAKGKHEQMGETYSIPLTNTHYISFFGNYLKEILNNEEWLSDRRKLLREIISTVTIGEKGDRFIF